ncbi:MAG: hypothetical protein PVF97_02210 [Desulfobacterales bacterium]
MTFHFLRNRHGGFYKTHLKRLEESNFGLARRALLLGPETAPIAILPNLNGWQNQPMPIPLLMEKKT